MRLYKLFIYLFLLFLLLVALFDYFPFVVHHDTRGQSGAEVDNEATFSPSLSHVAGDVFRGARAARRVTPPAVPGSFRNNLNTTLFEQTQEKLVHALAALRDTEQRAEAAERHVDSLTREGQANAELRQQQERVIAELHAQLALLEGMRGVGHGRRLSNESEPNAATVGAAPSPLGANANSKQSRTCMLDLYELLWTLCVLDSLFLAVLVYRKRCWRLRL